MRGARVLAGLSGSAVDTACGNRSSVVPNEDDVGPARALAGLSD